MIRTSVIVFALIACSSKAKDAASSPPPSDIVNPDLAPAKGSAATSVEHPLSPTTEDGRALTWTDAPLMEGVTVLPNRDSVVVEVPTVAGAADYRVYRLKAGVTLDGTQVLGGDVHCAGYKQRNIKAPEARELLRKIEVTGVAADSILVVEAVDKACPFTGVMGAAHAHIDMTNDEVPAADMQAFEVYTADEIRAAYGSVIRNGHGKGAVLGQPADVALAKPKVLARTAIRVTPVGAAPTVFLEDFSDDDQPRFLRNADDAGRSQRGKIFQNARWTFYSYGAEHTQFFIENGQLHSVIADWFQDIFATNIAYPRQTVQLDDTAYLKVSFDVASNATSRRYWWFFLCGGEQTLKPDGTLNGRIVQTSFFYQDDGRNPSVEGWNCFQLFPRDGWPFELNGKQPESDVRVMVNTAGAGERDSVVNVSPAQYKNANIGPPGWYGVLDDQTLISPRSRVTLFIRRDRVAMFVNGEQRLCNDFSTHKLTMPEAAIGFGHVLYHTTAERLEFSRDYWLRTGQRYYLENTPYVDTRSWDNLGFSEKVPAPAELDASKCFASP